MELANFHGFCKAVHALNITRIMALGDSIEYMRLISFFQTMGIASNVRSHLVGKKDGILRSAHKLDCTSVMGSSFSPMNLVFHRVNHLMPLLGSNESRWNVHGYEHFIYYRKLIRVYPDDDGFCPWVRDY